MQAVQKQSSPVVTEKAVGERNTINFPLYKFLAFTAVLFLSSIYIFVHYVVKTWR